MTNKEAVLLIMKRHCSECYSRQCKECEYNLVMLAALGHRPCWILCSELMPDVEEHGASERTVYHTTVKWHTKYNNTEHVEKRICSRLRYSDGTPYWYDEINEYSIEDNDPYTTVVAWLRSPDQCFDPHESHIS